MFRVVAFMTWALSASMALGQGFLVTTLENQNLMASEDLGAQLALTIDIDLDGVDDIAAATTSGAVVLLSGADLSILGRLEGADDPTEFYGFSVADLGDVDGDGFRDLAIGIPGRNGGTGAVEIRSVKTDSILHTISGTESGSAFGVVVAAIEDRDGDGRDDLAVSAPFFAGGQPTPIGQVSLHSSATGTASLILTGASSAPGFGLDIAPAGLIDGDAVPDILMVAEGTTARVFSGATGAVLRTYGQATSVESLGDVDSDGITDHLVCNPNGNASAFSGASGVQIFSVPSPDSRVAAIGDISGDGNVDFAVLSLIGNILNPALVTLRSGANGSVLGMLTPPSFLDFTVAALGRGDLDGDGFFDIFVGFSRGTFGGANRDGVLRWSNGTMTHVVEGTSTLDQFGAALTTLDDIDGDGVADLAVGAPASAGASIGAGQVEVHSGADLSVIHSIPGQTLAALGNDVTGTGDLDGDGIGDLFATAVGFSAPSDGMAISGSDGSTIWQLPGTTETPQRCAAVGDFDNDTIPDIIVVYRNATTTSGPLLRLHSGADGSVQPAPVFSGLTTATTILNVVGVPDVDGDGEDDLAASAGDSAGTNGLVQLYSSQTLAPLWTVAGTSNERLGSSLALAGDWNGDGTADLVVGRPFSQVLPSGNFLTGGAVILSGSDGSVLASVSGDIANERAGRSVGIFEDLDGDGFTEVALTSTPDIGSSDVRRLRIVSPTTGHTFFERSYALTAFNNDLQLLPTSDIDGDGLAELFVGIPEEQILRGRVEVISAVGLPIGTSTFGVGCSTMGALEPQITTYGGVPTSAGNGAFGIALTNAPASTVATLLVGQSNTTWALGALPFDLSPFGYAGCAILTSSEIEALRATNPSLTGHGAAFVDIPIPAFAALAGFTFHAQWFVPEVSTSNFPAVLSQGLTVTIQ